MPVFLASHIRKAPNNTWKLTYVSYLLLSRSYYICQEQRFFPCLLAECRGIPLKMEYISRSVALLLQSSEHSKSELKHCSVIVFCLSRPRRSHLHDARQATAMPWFDRWAHDKKEIASMYYILGALTHVSHFSLYSLPFFFFSCVYSIEREDFFCSAFAKSDLLTVTHLPVLSRPWWKSTNSPLLISVLGEIKGWFIQKSTYVIDFSAKRKQSFPILLPD